MFAEARVADEEAAPLLKSTNAPPTHSRVVLGLAVVLAGLAGFAAATLTTAPTSGAQQLYAVPSSPQLPGAVGDIPGVRNVPTIPNAPDIPDAPAIPEGCGPKIPGTNWKPKELCPAYCKDKVPSQVPSFLKKAFKKWGKGCCECEDPTPEPSSSGPATMSCGDGVSVCGVLALQTGLGPDKYAHASPVVHGLWPENPPYGDAECVAPEDVSAPTVVVDCYEGLVCPNCDDNPADPVLAALHFEEHEWSKHGVCAGVTDVTSYLEQTCSLAADPLVFAAEAMEGGADLDHIVSRVKDAGYSIWSVYEASAEIMLSACATSDGVWKLAAPEDFPAVCGSMSYSYSYEY